MIIIGSGHHAFIHDGNCTFLIAFGDDYQTFGKRFPAKVDDQWQKMREILSKTECANNIRAVKAMFKGTVSRVPATGIIPSDETPLQMKISRFRSLSRAGSLFASKPLPITVDNVWSAVRLQE